MSDIKTDARKEEAKQPDPTFEDRLLEQNVEILQILEGIYWALGGPMIANTNKQQFMGFTQYQQAEAEKKQAKRIIAPVVMPVPATMPKKE